VQELMQRLNLSSSSDEHSLIDAAQTLIRPDAECVEQIPHHPHNAMMSTILDHPVAMQFYFFPPPSYEDSEGGIKGLLFLHRSYKLAGLD
jgi:hypothetical protein